MIHKPSYCSDDGTTSVGNDETCVTVRFADNDCAAQLDFRTLICGRIEIHHSAEFYGLYRGDAKVFAPLAMGYSGDVGR